MLKLRLIPVVLLKNGRVVQSKSFRRHQVLGNPSTIVWRLSNWFSDELIYLDITRDGSHDLRRDDLKYENETDLISIIKSVAAKCFMPLSVGGGIRSISEVLRRLHAGADKVTLNTGAINDPSLITTCAREVGSQCVVLSIDARRHGSSWEVFSNCGRDPTSMDPVTWARKAQHLGVGEILINSIDNDGKGGGYDLELVAAVAEAVTVPVIALGGVGRWEHFAEAIGDTAVSAVAAANIFQYTENSIFNAKSYLYERGYDFRKPLVHTITEDSTD